MKAQWAEKSIEIAESLDMSWHYWGFTKVGGFEAYDRNEATWYEGFPAAFGL
jgi:endoglucanase